MLKLSEIDEANDEMDTDGAVTTDLSSAVSSEKESVVCDIIDDIIDAAVSSSLLENYSAEVGTDDPSANYHTGYENQDDVSPMCIADKSDNVDHAVERDASGCSDVADSKSVSKQALAENPGDTSTSSSPSTSSTSSPDTDESDQFGGYTVNHVGSDSDDAAWRKYS